MLFQERTRIGIVTPDDAVNDDEYWRYVNDDITLMIDRYRTPERFAPISSGMVSTYGNADLLADCSETLRITRPNALVFFCNSCSFVGGKAANLEICRRMEEAGGAPATTISMGQVEALRAMGVDRVAVGAPYQEEVTEKFHRFLGEYGISVVASKSLGMTTEWQIGNATPAVWKQLALDVDRPEAQCIVIACSGTRTAPIIQEVESELGKPFLSAPGAGIWHALRLAGYQRPVARAGVLFSRYLP